MPKSSLKKLISSVLLFIFTAAHLGQDAQAWASFQSEVPSAQALFELNLPPELGTIQEINSGSGPVIMQIQTAHGSYEAQKNIQGILHYLKDKYGMKFLLLEGSGSELQPELLNLFPGRKDLNMKAADALTHEALVKGDELFLLEEKDAEAYGIEDIPVYHKARDIFKKVILKKETTSNFLKDLDLQIERLTASYLNPELRAFLKNKESFEGDKTSFQAWLLEIRDISKKRLQLDLSRPSTQFDWPMLTRTLKLQEYESKINPDDLGREKKIFKVNIAKFSPRNLSGIERVINLPLSHNGIADEMSRRVIEDMISALPPSFPYADYPNLKMFLGRLIIQSEINPSLLMGELERLSAEIIQRMSRSEEETKWAVLLKKYEILRRLFALELTPADYETLLSGRESFRPSVLTQAFKEINRDKRVKDFNFEHLNEIDKLFEVSMDFYKITKERDGIMLRNIQKKMDEKHIGKAVVITGGFHAKVFKDFFASQGFNYALISPKITSSQGREEYLRAVLQTDFGKIAGSTMDLPRRMETSAVQQAMGENIVFVNAAVDRVIKNINRSELSQAEVAARTGYEARSNFKNRSEVRAETEITPEEEMRRVLEIYPRIAEHTAEYGLHHLLTAGKYFWQEDSETDGVFDLHIKGNPEDDDKWGECTVGSCLAARTLNENGIKADVYRMYMSGETIRRPLDTGKLGAFKSWDYLRKAAGKLTSKKSVEIVPIMQSHAIARTRSGLTVVDASGFFKTYSDQTIPVWGSENYPVAKFLKKGFVRKVYEESGYRSDSIIFPLKDTEKKDADFPLIGYQPVKLHKLKGVEGHELTIMSQLGIGRLKETQDLIFSYAVTYRIFDPKTQTYKAPQSLYLFWTIPQKEFFEKIQPSLKKIAAAGDFISAQTFLFGLSNKPKIIINEGADGSPEALSLEWGRMPEIFKAAEEDFSYFVSFMAAIPKFSEPPQVVFLFKPRVPEEQIESVYLSGSFNEWPNPGIPMEKKNGLWSVQLPLKRKPYEYKYQIKFKDGRFEWVSYQDDLYNPDVNRGTSDNYGVNRGLEIKEYLYWKFKPGLARELAKNFTKLLFHYLDQGLVISGLAEGSLENFHTEQWIWSYVQLALNDRGLLREKPESFSGYSFEIIQQALVEMIHRDGPGPVYDLSEIEEGMRDAWPSGSRPRSEMRGAQTIIRYPAATRPMIADWFEKKIGFGGVSVQGGNFDPKSFDRKEFNLINNPWKLDYGVPNDWARNKLLPLMESITNPYSAPDKEPALKEMVAHHFEKGTLPETWKDMPVVPEILFPVSETPGLLNSLKGQRSNITFNLIPGEGKGVFSPVLIKTGENIEEEAIYDAVFDRAGLKEFIGVVNLPGGEKGIVYRIIPSGNAWPRGDAFTVHVVSELLDLHGYPSQLQTRFGTAVLDLANFKDDSRNGSIVREIIKKYNEIYAEQNRKTARSEVRSEKGQKDKRDEAIDFLSRTMPDLEEEYDLPAGRDLFFRFNGSKHEREGVYHGSDFRDIAGAMDLVGLGSGDKYWTWGVGTGRDLLVANAFGADIAAGEELGEPAFKAAEKIIYGRNGAQDIVSLAKAAGHDVFDTGKISIHQADWFKDGILSPSGQRRLKDFDVFYYYIHGSMRQDEMIKILAQNMHERAVLIVYDPFGGWNVPKDLTELKVSRWTRNGRIRLYVKPGSPLLTIRKESRKPAEGFDRRAADVKTLYLEGWKTTQATLEFLDHFPNASNITVHNPEMTDVDIFRMVQGFFRGAGKGQGSVKFTGGRAFDIEWKGRIFHFELTAEAFQGNADAMVLDSPRSFISDRRADEKLKPYFESLYQHLNPGGLMMLADSPAYYFPFEFAWIRTTKIDYLGNKSFPEDEFSDWRIFSKSISSRSELRTDSSKMLPAKPELSEIFKELTADELRTLKGMTLVLSVLNYGKPSARDVSSSQEQKFLLLKLKEIFDRNPESDLYIYIVDHGSNFWYSAHSRSRVQEAFHHDGVKEIFERYGLRENYDQIAGGKNMSGDEWFKILQGIHGLNEQGILNSESVLTYDLVYGIALGYYPPDVEFYSTKSDRRSEIPPNFVRSVFPKLGWQGNPKNSKESEDWIQSYVLNLTEALSKVKQEIARRSEMRSEKGLEHLEDLQRILLNAESVESGNLGAVIDPKRLVLNGDQNQALAESLAKIHREIFEYSRADFHLNTPEGWLKAFESSDSRILLLINSSGKITGLAFAKLDAKSEPELKQFGIIKDGISYKGKFLFLAFLRQILLEPFKTLTWETSFMTYEFYERVLTRESIPYKLNYDETITIERKDLEKWAVLNAGAQKSVGENEARSEMRTKLLGYDRDLEEKLNPELNALKGSVYYPAAGSDFRVMLLSYLQHMPGIKKIILNDAGYKDLSETIKGYLKIRDASPELRDEGTDLFSKVHQYPEEYLETVYLLEEKLMNNPAFSAGLRKLLAEGVPVHAVTLELLFLGREIQFETKDGWNFEAVWTKDEKTQPRPFQLEVIPGDSSNLPLKDRDIALIRVNRAGNSHVLSKTNPLFHARLISDLKVGGILYYSPTDREPLVHSPENYNLLGLEFLGFTAQRKKYFRKKAEVDPSVVLSLIEADIKADVRSEMRSGETYPDLSTPVARRDSYEKLNVEKLGWKDIIAKYSPLPPQQLWAILENYILYSQAEYYPRFKGDKSLIARLPDSNPNDLSGYTDPVPDYVFANLANLYAAYTYLMHQKKPVNYDELTKSFENRQGLPWFEQLWLTVFALSFFKEGQDYLRKWLSISEGWPDRDKNYWEVALRDLMKEALDKSADGTALESRSAADYPVLMNYFRARKAWMGGNDNWQRTRDQGYIAGHTMPAQPVEHHEAVLPAGHFIEKLAEVDKYYSLRSELRLVPDSSEVTPALKTRVEFTGYLFPLEWIKKFGKESLMKVLAALGLLSDENNHAYSETEIQAAKKFLGIQTGTQIPDAFILGSDLALNNGGLVLIDTFLKGSAVAIAADSKEAADRLELYNKERAAKGQKPVLIVKKLDEAEKAFAGRFQSGVNLYGFASPDEISEEWARILKDKLQVFNARRMEVFAETFGVSKLLESFKARFSFAKSA